MYRAGLLDRFASGSRASATVHPDLEEEAAGFDIAVENVSDHRVFRYFHFVYPFF